MRRVTTAALTLLGASTLAIALVVGVVARGATALLALESPSRRVPAVSASPEAAHPAFAAAGPHAVGVRRFAPPDSPLPMTLWYPAHPDGDARPLRYSTGAAVLGAGTAVAVATSTGRAVPGAAPDLSAAPYASVVLSPGFGLSTGGYGWLAEHLASHGLVVAAPQHSEALDPGLLWQATADRPRDVRDAVDFLEDATGAGGVLDGLVDPGRLAVAGHSYGGFTALALAGARLDTPSLREACEQDGGPDGVLALQCDALLPNLGRLAGRTGLTAVPDGRWPSWADPRVDAAVVIAGDALMFGPDGLGSVRRPVLAVGGTADTDAPLRWGTRPAYEATSSPRKAELVLGGAGHFTFTGRCDSPRRILRLVPSGFCSEPAGERGDAHRLVAHHVTAFVLAELVDDPEAARTLGAPPTLPQGASWRTEGY